MATLSDIKRRIKSVKNTQQITKAMKMVSAAKLRRAQEDIIAARPYADKIQGLVASLSKAAGPETNPLFLKPEPEDGEKTPRLELVLMASDRGLCGGFNSTLIRTAERFIRENSSKEISLNLIGKRAFEHFKDRERVKSRALGIARPSYALAEEIATELMDGYLSDGSDEVYMIYSEFKSAITQRPVVQKLLPITPPKEEEQGEETYEEFIFEPSQQRVLDSLLPKFVVVQVFRALLETAASEHGARMTAMDSASRNAAEMIGHLTLLFNRARQAAITKELMEIIGGAEALKG